MTFRLSKSDRLLKSLEFKKTLESGARKVGQRLVLVAKANQEKTSRLGLVVSKKVGKSVTRNKVKRLLREKFRHIKEQLPGMDIVVIARAKAAEASSSEVMAELEALTKKLHKKVLG